MHFSVKGTSVCAGGIAYVFDCCVIIAFLITQINEGFFLFLLCAVLFFQIFSHVFILI